MARPLSVLNVAFPFANVGRNAVGGAEQVLSALDFALENAGFRSTVIGCDGSSTAGTLISVPRTRAVLIDDDLRSAIHATMRDTVAEVVRHRLIDIVHFDDGSISPNTLPPPGLPTLVTLHLPPSAVPKFSSSAGTTRYLAEWCVRLTERCIAEDCECSMRAPI